MTVYHRRTLGIIGGRTAAAIAAFREFQEYHKRNGVEYLLQVPFGGESMRMSLVSTYAGLGDIEKYYRKLMSDPVFQDLSAKQAANVITGSSHDHFAREILSAAQLSVGPLMHIRSSEFLPGRINSARAVQRELIDHLAACGVGHFVTAPAGVGSPLRTAMVARYPGAAELEAFNAKLVADSKWQEIVARQAYNMVSVSDQMWITI